MAGHPLQVGLQGRPDDGLVFVTVSHPEDVKNRDNQRTIRSRVMRDIGRLRRTRRRPPAKVTFSLEEIPLVTNKNLPTITHDYIPNSIPSWPFPVELDSRARELVHFMNSESDYIYRPFRTVWFSMALTDASAFKLSMANASMFLAQRKDPKNFRYETCSESLEYYGKCLSLVSRRLEDPNDRVSEGVITTILGFICHDLYVGTWDRWMAHISGLHLIYKLRGGFNGLNPNVSLFASWYDILGCVVEDKFPFFPNNTFDVPQEYVKPHPLQIIIQRLIQTSSDMTPLANALDRIGSVAYFININSKEPNFWTKEDDMTPLHLMGPVIHILLSMPRLDRNSQTVNSLAFLRELTRLAMLILLAATKQMYSFASNETHLLENKFLDLVSIYSSLFENFFPNLQLWAVLTVAALHSRSNNMILYAMQIRRQMGLLGIESANAALETAKGIVWIDAVAGAKLDQSLAHAIDGTPPSPCLA